MHTAKGNVYNRQSIFDNAESEFKKALNSDENYKNALKNGEIQVGNQTVQMDMYYGEVQLRANFDLTELLQTRNEDTNGATNINNVEGQEQAVKFIQNGQMFIKKNGVVYDMMGHIVR